MDGLIRNDGIQKKYTSTGRHSGYQVSLYHTGLDEHKHFSAVEPSALQGKIRNQENTWEKKWAKELLKQEQQTKEEDAKAQTEKAHLKIQQIENLLAHTLEVDDAINWQTLKHNDAFFLDLELSNQEAFIQLNHETGYPETRTEIKTLPEPQSKHFLRGANIFWKLLGQEEKVKQKQQQAFEQAIVDTREKNIQIEEENADRKKVLKDKQDEWKKEEKKFKKAQKKHNDNIDTLQKEHKKKSVNAVTEYCEMVLANSEYPDSLSTDFELQYNDQNGILVIDYKLPIIDDIPSVNHVRYIKSRDAIETKKLSNAAHARLYDHAIYQIALRTLHEVFEADTVDAVACAVFNGFVTVVSPTTGHEETSCILSLQAKKEEFETINLEGIVNNQSYKECFKSLKGVGSTKLSTLTPIKPILEMDKSDKRFKDHYEVADGLNEEMNIAAMDWEDFEHLVREIFQKEFAGNGGEVKVTQASSDGGVDAIAFDPDPIRGGKIVIQAKRYTNVVGVAAVRDLYGTVVNEGATKGVLVTTSDYGADSYEFVKDKPLTLLSGSNLLHLLEKHGHKAKIDVKEAKKILKEKAA